MAKRKSRSGALFIIIFLVLLGLIIYAYKDKLELFLKYNFKSGKDFFTKKREKFKAFDNIKKFFSDKNEIDEKKDLKVAKDSENLKQENKKELIELEKNSKSNEITTDKTNITRSKEKEETREVKTEKKNLSLNNERDNWVEKEKKVLNKKIYFTKLTDNGSLLLFPVNRKIEYINTPLTETLKSLIEGPNEIEKKNNIITNIPNNTKLLGVTIKDGIAYINLSKEFENNYFGKESMIAQVKQIVFTACEFPNIKAVQLLIDNKIQTYLGGEGVVINRPFTKKDFE